MLPCDNGREGHDHVPYFPIQFFTNRRPIKYDKPLTGCPVTHQLNAFMKINVKCQFKIRH